MEWKPIETAPKDGTKVLLVCMSPDSNSSVKAGYMAVDWYRQASDKRGYIGWGEFNAQYFPATHWMSLPPLPQSPAPQGQTS